MIDTTTLTVQAAQRWEYHYLQYSTGRDFNNEAPAALNRLGSEGWEVCGFVRYEVGRIDGYRILLKRPHARAAEPA